MDGGPQLARVWLTRVETRRSQIPAKRKPNQDTTAHDSDEEPVATGRLKKRLSTMRPVIVDSEESEDEVGK